MSHVTETVHVRGVKSARVLAAIEEHFRAKGFVKVAESERARAEREEPNLRRIALRRTKSWTTVVDADEGHLDEWSEHLSRVLARSVLAIWTWDGEASVVATRWKKGRVRRKLTLLDQAFRGEDGRPRAPAKILWPWLPPARREAILRDGIALVEPDAGTGDEDLDAMLEEFDDIDREDSLSADDSVFASERVSVAALGAAVGLTRPFLEPMSLAEGARELLFEPASPRRSRLR